MGDVAQSLSKAIKESKWLSIDYQNKDNDTTSYWCSIIDIDLNSKRIFINAFNIAKIQNDTKGVLSGVFLLFDNILRADVLDHTTYERPNDLIKKIELNIEKLSWLKYDLYNESILDYIKDCIKYDAAPYQKETTLVSAVDEKELMKYKKQGFMELNYAQMSDLVYKIEKLAKQDKEKTFKITELTMNLLSIATRSGLFVCAYKKLLFDPANKHLAMDDEIYYNYEFASDEHDTFKHNLRNYLDMEVDAFTELFEVDPNKAKKMLAPSLKRFNEQLDDRPYIMDLIRSYNGYLEKEFLAISEAKRNQTLSTPLKAFFGNMDTSLLSRKRAFDIVLLDHMMNVDQLRVIHNALKQPITYVQGPPGTGKTQSILNLLISAFFNEQTVLVSSNNNKPIDDIYIKLRKLESRKKQIPLPILRLGNNQKVKESMEMIKGFIKDYEFYASDDTKLSSIELSSKKNMKDINEIIDQYEKRLELEEEIDALESILTHFSTQLRSSVIIQSELTEKEKELKALPIHHDDEIHEHVVKANEYFFTWLFFTSVKYIKKLKEPKYEAFLEILNIENEDEQIRKFNQFLHEPINLKLIQRVFPIIMTTNQSAYRLGLPEPSFDLTIIDEAGQCSIGHALFPIIRGKRLLLVGDQNQLKPVITLSPESNKKLMKKHNISKSYNYVNNSIIRLMQSVDSISKFILLRYHYRCHKDIIEFSNKKYYKSKLIIPERKGFDDQALSYLQVNQSLLSRSNIRNTSLKEIDAIIDDIKQHDRTSVGIITPFRNQADLIKERIKQEHIEHVDVGTVHTFQGDEKDSIYLTTAITSKSSPKTFDWVKNNEELINVATTRAKKEFIMVGDFKEIKKRSKESNDLFELANYIQQNGKEVFLKPKDNDSYVNSMNYRQYNTTKEKELLETINHVLSFGNKHSVNRQVKISDILNQFTEPELFDYATKAVFDFVIYEKIKNDDIPRVVIELDGDEHTFDLEVKARDLMKEKICNDNHIKLIRIPNNYSRRYVFMKDIIYKLIKV